MAQGSSARTSSCLYQEENQALRPKPIQQCYSSPERPRSCTCITVSHSTTRFNVESQSSYRRYQRPLSAISRRCERPLLAVESSSQSLLAAVGGTRLTADWHDRPLNGLPGQGFGASHVESSLRCRRRSSSHWMSQGQIRLIRI